MNKIFSIALVSALFFAACTDPRENGLKLTTWRATLKTESGKEIPFNFVVNESPDKKKVIDILNGSEHFRVDKIDEDPDSVRITMPLFDSEIRAAFADDKLKGNWIRHLADKDVMIPFEAEPDAKWRFFTDESPSDLDISGRWATTFGEGSDTSSAIGEFKQNGPMVTGTFLTNTGDYRFLQGTIKDSTLYLSCFDGGHAFLFTGKIDPIKKTISAGEFYSGLSGQEKWTAVFSPQAKLPDAYGLTHLKPGEKSIAFSFPDLNGKKVSLTDPAYKGKVVIVQMLGSWCPNCMDETAYLADDFYKRYQPKGVEIVGLAYERTPDFDRSKKNVSSLIERFKVPYTVLLTGYTPAKGEPAKSLPALESLNAFPTTFIIDKKGEVRKIHQGFSGPGTGEHYTEFKQEFEHLIDQLLAEKG
ncbi:MAG: TlpA family protein disulfide reductase [Mucilaginibacter polytrichastri]|nr:TlpA family protein disulfide reductase [Mucilaginibacter polytrichastri]